MGKAVIWRTKSKEIEFSKNDKNEVSLSFKDLEGSTVWLSLSLTKDDVIGIEKILFDYRYELQDDQEEKEVSNVI